MSNKKLTIQQEIENILWPNSNDLSLLKQRCLTALRILYVTLLDLMGGHISLRAMSLVYTTLLSIVPLLALSFSVLKAMGAHNEIEPFLFQFLAPLGEQGIEIGNNIIGFIDNIKVGVLGSVGLGLLIYTVLSLVQKIENAFNMIWRVKGTRSIGERFSNYLSVIMIGPVLMVSAIGMTATVMNSSFVHYFSQIEPFGLMLLATTKLLPYVVVMGVFMFVYMFVPNTRVHVMPALIGAIIAGFLWETSGLVFASFVVTSTQYAAIYSSFAVMILLLIWLYLSWLILLMGSNIAFYIQNPSYLHIGSGDIEISSRVKERLALQVMALIGQRYQTGEPALSVEEIVERTQVPSIIVCYVIDKLIAEKLLLEAAGRPVTLLPAKALDRMQLIDVIRAIQMAEERACFSANSIALPKRIEQLTSELEGALAATLNKQTVADLVAKDD